MTRRVTASGVALALLLALIGATGLLLAPTAHASGGAFVSMINSARASAGLPALSSRSDLTSVAAAWSRQMAASGTLAHNPALASQVSGYRYVGENVGYGPDAATIHRAFMDSPSHRANVLDRDYTQVGVAVVESGGRLWVTEVFRAPAGATTAAKPASGDGAATGRSGGSSGSGTATAPSTRSGTSSGAGTTGRARPAPPPPPSPEELLRRRAAAAAAGPGTAPAGDPVQQALRFADVLRAVRG